MDQIQTYITSQRASGVTDEEIKMSLANNGHSPEAITQYFTVPSQTSDTIVDGVRLYSYWNIAGAAVIGGPLAVVYMMQKNYEAWGETELAGMTRRWGIIGTVLTYTALNIIILLLPEDNDTRFGFIISIAAFTLASHYQGVKLKDHKKQGGRFIGFWKSLGVALISILITLLLLAVIFTIVYVIFTSLGLAV